MLYFKHELTVWATFLHANSDAIIVGWTTDFILHLWDNPNCARGPLLMYLSRVKERQIFENKWAILMFHCNLFSIYREHFEMSRLHLTENNNKPEDWNRNILGRKFSKKLWPLVILYLWPESMSIQGKLQSFQGKLEIWLVIFSHINFLTRSRF